MVEYRRDEDLEMHALSQREEKARKMRNVAIAAGLGGLVLLFYASTLSKLGPAAVDRPVTGAPQTVSRPDPDFDKISRRPREEVGRQRIVTGDPNAAPRRAEPRPQRVEVLE